MARKRSGDKSPKRKKVTVKLLDRKHAGKITSPYRTMERLIAEHHEHLKDAKIAIAWRCGWNADPDGRIKLGQCKKGSDLDREMNGYDFVILLNEDRWPALKAPQQEAVLDHELCHAAVSMDTNGKPKFDQRGRKCYRIRKHDIEEFSEVVKRHGCYKGDVERFADIAADRRERPLLAAADGEGSENGDAPTTDATGNDGAATTDANKLPKNWRAVTIAQAGINGKVGKALTEAGIHTLGELTDRQAKDGTWWARGIKGLGAAGVDYIDDRTAAFYAEHPEYAEAQSAAPEQTEPASATA